MPKIPSNKGLIAQNKPVLGGKAPQRVIVNNKAALNYKQAAENERIKREKMRKAEEERKQRGIKYYVRIRRKEEKRRAIS